MRSHTYTKFSAMSADQVDMQELLDKLADFLLQSGFAGGKQEHPFWGETGDDADKSLDALRQAILDALIQSGQFTPEMLDALRGDGDDVSEAKMNSISPANFAAADFPPTMLITGNNDVVVDWRDSQLMYQRLVDAGARAELHVFEGAPHAFDALPNFGRQCAGLMSLFLDRTVLDR